MSKEFHELHINVRQLLNDVCKFLSCDLNIDKLTPQIRDEVDNLISRSKIQINEISKILQISNEYDGAYVDMEKNIKDSIELHLTGPVDCYDEKTSNIYSSVEENTVKFTPKLTCPYNELSAKDLCQLKCGYLSWKTRIILNFEKMKRIYAGIHNNWLLIYSNEKDSKPFRTFNLNFYEAKTVTCKNSKILPRDFELISTMDDKKSFYFLALTYSDMVRWVENINQNTQMENEQENLERYDLVGNETDNGNGNEVIYHDIESYNHFSVVNHLLSRNSRLSGTEYSGKLPDLPLRPPENPREIKVDDDNIYEQFTSFKEPIIFKIAETPKKLLVKPEIKEKPKHLILNKKSMFCKN